MKKYIQVHPWEIIESGFHSEFAKISESIFSLGNGRMGQRANFEEHYSGQTLQGSYLAGVYYPDKTRVGWWKNGYPEYFAKVLNSVSWNQIRVIVDGVEIDLNKYEPIDFERTLDMKNGLLKRAFSVIMPSGVKLSIETQRWTHMSRKNLGGIRMQITPDRDCEINIYSVITGDIRNQDSNYDEFFWEDTQSGYENAISWVSQKTKKTGFHVHAGTRTYTNCCQTSIISETKVSELSVDDAFRVEAKSNESIEVVKYAVVLSDMYVDTVDFSKQMELELNEAAECGWQKLCAEQATAWQEVWDNADIQIEGDDTAQQAIRFNIFQLYQTYTGDDSRLNIGPKGFTGEKYGGSTYWDTEAYCLPFYLGTATSDVAKNLLVYRHNHLPKAIENAEKLGFTNGAALYPMVTMNGEECHNEWEITFEEIHRNGAIAYAIYDYINYTGDEEYMETYGIDVLVGIARFWSQRVNYSENKKQWVMLGVTGPNEFENNVNNNWYTNKMAVWCMQYAKDSLAAIQESNLETYQDVIDRLNIQNEEIDRWKEIGENMYFPLDEQKKVYLQQDGFLDKELIPVSELEENQRPIVEHWSWDKILRSCYIKQADVLQGFYFFEDEFDLDEHKRHFDFYEPLTVHESSLSPCVHSILANKIGNHEKAYEFYLRTARLDLEDINNDTCDGCHITSMAGTWLSVSKGFAGMRVKDGILTFNPNIPKKWSSIGFNIKFRDNYLRVQLSHESSQLSNLDGPAIDISVNGSTTHIPSNKTINI
ncbi:family 65 glycosyl hydrolase domain-containing protein [Bacteroidia bacterium]|nr:family 65 glycosyl hydrolase domain-containing protein [Bacteroidia bacterium]MDA9214168.1 family 65 glycosyl hydrolase domain-containing protein [Bacteroidia bacterium]